MVAIPTEIGQDFPEDRERDIGIMDTILRLIRTNRQACFPVSNDHDKRTADILPIADVSPCSPTKLDIPEVAKVSPEGNSLLQEHLESSGWCDCCGAPWVVEASTPSDGRKPVDTSNPTGELPRRRRKFCGNHSDGYFLCSPY